MNQRERFLKTTHFEKTDRPPMWEFGYWDETLERWHSEGMPEDVYPAQFFGLDTASYFGDEPGYGVLRFFNNVGLLPPFKEEIIEENEEYRIYIDKQGITRKEFKRHSASSMPHWLKFPVEDRKSWERLKKRLNPKSQSRYPVDWEFLKKAWKDSDFPLAVFAGSLFGQLRDWIGMERFVTMFYDDHKLVHEMMEYMSDFFIQSVRKALDEVKFDHAHFWEDMAYKTGPLISPEMARKFMLPHYKKMTDSIRSHGIDIISVDCDGNCSELIPVWLEVGINMIYPCEAAAGMDAVVLRKKYGRDLIMAGGIDKRVLTKGKKDIEEEVMRKVPYLIKIGGYIPTVDHSVPPDVPLENYLYYLGLLKKCFGIRDYRKGYDS